MSQPSAQWMRLIWSSSRDQATNSSQCRREQFLTGVPISIQGILIISQVIQALLLITTVPPEMLMAESHSKAKENMQMFVYFCQNYCYKRILNFTLNVNNSDQLFTLPFTSPFILLLGQFLEPYILHINTQHTTHTFITKSH